MASSVWRRIVKWSADSLIKATLFFSSDSARITTLPPRWISSKGTSSTGPAAAQASPVQPGEQPQLLKALLVGGIGSPEGQGSSMLGSTCWQPGRPPYSCGGGRDPGFTCSLCPDDDWGPCPLGRMKPRERADQPS